MSTPAWINQVSETCSREEILDYLIEENKKLTDALHCLSCVGKGQVGDQIIMMPHVYAAAQVKRINGGTIIL